MDSVIFKKYNLKAMRDRGNWAILAIFVLGCLLRIYGLGFKSLWYDEAALLFEANKNFIQLFNINIEGIHPPLYRLIMHFWLFLGSGDVMARIPSLFFSLGCIILGYKTARLIFGKPTALWVALFIAVSPFQVYYAQEVKSYALFFLVSLSSLYFFIKAIKDGNRSFWLWYVFFSVLSLYTHYFGFLNIFAQNIFIIINSQKLRQGLLKKWLFMQRLIFLFFIPWLYAAFKHIDRVIGDFWIPKVSSENIFTVFKNFTFGFYSGNLNYLFLQVLLAALILTGLISIFFLKINRKDYPQARENITLLFSFLLIPALTLVISSVRPLFLDRALIFFSFFYYIILSAAMLEISKKKALFSAVVFLLAILFSVSLKNQYTQDNFVPTVGAGSIKKEFRQAAAYISRYFHKGDKVILSHYSSWPSFNYYFPVEVKSQLYLDDPLGRLDSGDPYSRSRLKQQLGFRMMNMDSFAEEEGGVWVVCSDWSSLPFVSLELREWMSARKKSLYLKNLEFNGIELYYFK